MDELDVILFGLSTVLSDEHDRTVGAFTAPLLALIDDENWEDAIEHLEKFDLSQVYTAKKDQVEYHAYLAFLWGVQTLNNSAQPKSVIAGVVPTVVETASNQIKLLLASSSQTLIQAMREQILELSGELSNLETAQKSEGVKEDKPTKQRILTQYKQRLKDTAKSNGKGLIDLVSSLNASRLASYGYMNEATLVGITHYKYNALIDSRTSDVCNHLNGKVFPVAPAYARLDAELRINDSDAMKAHSPWVKNTQADVAAFKELSKEELMDKGWAYPPMHPHCRSVVEYIRGTIQVGGLEIPTSNKGLSEVMTGAEIQSLIRTLGTSQATINLAKGMLLAGVSALEVMQALAISAETLALIQAAIDFDLA